MVNEWMKYYELAKEYYLTNHNLRIPYKYVTEDGINLGAWIKYQRQRYNGTTTGKNLTDVQIHMLNEIHMIWDVSDDIWKRNYMFAVEYYHANGNLQIPKSYKINGICLGTWIDRQRQANKGQGTCKLTDDKILLLDNIGMLWNIYTTRNQQNCYQK